MKTKTEAGQRLRTKIYIAITLGLLILVALMIIAVQENPKIDGRIPLLKDRVCRGLTC